MTLFQVIAVLVSLAALFSWLSVRFLPVHETVGVMLLALAASLLLILAERFDPALQPVARQFLDRVRFDQALLLWMLGFLLFAGALSVETDHLRGRRILIAALAVVGMPLSTALLGGMAWLIFAAIGNRMPPIDCLLLGAILSPTDPIAVVGVMRRVGSRRDIESVVAAESLVNDGVGVVVFLTLLELSRRGGSVTPPGVATLFVRQSLGGLALGLVTGECALRLLRQRSSRQVAILMTLALVMGACALADRWNLSGPIAVVTAALLLRARGGIAPAGSRDAGDLREFWESVDEILNAVLFLMIGLVVALIPRSLDAVRAGVLMIPAALLARWISVAGVVRLFPRRDRTAGALIRILTWGGLRGGLPIAMALSLPEGAARDRIVPVTYCVALFSIAVQGTTVGPLIRGRAREDVA